MEVIRAKSAGFCFGVKRAVDTVYEQVEKQTGKQIYTYGPIIHNEEVVKDMEAHGVKVLHSEEELKGLEEGLVIIRSHGVPKRICDLMNEKGIEYVDDNHFVLGVQFHPEDLDNTENLYNYFLKEVLKRKK